MNKNKKQLRISQKKIKQSFTGNRLTAYSGINSIHKKLFRGKIFKRLYQIFPVVVENASKFSDVQLIGLMIYASLCRVNRLKNIEIFSADPLIKSVLNLSVPMSDSTLSGRFKDIGERGSRELEEFLLKENKEILSGIREETITIDMDSTVSMVYGEQEGAERGYNPKKKGLNSYHPLLAFISEYKTVMHTWFRPGNTYTSNGSEEFIKQILAYMPENIKGIFFRMDCGFFDNKIIDLIEERGYEYLIKVKLKGLKDLLKIQKWEELKEKPGYSIYEFKHTFTVINEEGNRIKITRPLKAVRIQTKAEKGTLGEDIIEYEYFCYCSNKENTNAIDLHNMYKPRGESENWIEQVKNQLLAGKTIVDDFWANSIFWQLSVLAYNLSILIRMKVKRYWQQEYNTFREWFVRLPGMLVKSGKELILKIYQWYYYRKQWEEFSLILLSG